MKKPCDDFLPALVDASEGQPTPELEAHLPTCEGCRAELAELGASLALLAPEPAPEPGPWLAPKIRAHHESRAPRRNVLRWALPALVPVSLIVTVVLTGPSPRDGQEALPTFEALAAELATLDADTLESVLGESEATRYTGLPSSEDLLGDLALALVETDEEVLDTVLSETGFGTLGYDEESYDAVEGLGTELDLLLEAIPG
ncbi:MAG: hypothetical protein P1V51_15045 [Deltaproteobacteria bacterium]|nr:hypothetical protein [Deltaproteobacteria bacterium]